MKLKKRHKLFPKHFKNRLNVNTLFRQSPAIFPACEHFKTECVLFGMISIRKVGTWSLLDRMLRYNELLSFVERGEKLLRK